MFFILGGKENHLNLKKKIMVPCDKVTFTLEPGSNHNNNNSSKSRCRK